jgi:hypothetical protein
MLVDRKPLEIGAPIGCLTLPRILPAVLTTAVPFSTAALPTVALPRVPKNAPGRTRTLPPAGPSLSRRLSSLCEPQSHYCAAAIGFTHYKKNNTFENNKPLQHLRILITTHTTSHVHAAALKQTIYNANIYIYMHTFLFLSKQPNQYTSISIIYRNFHCLRKTLKWQRRNVMRHHHAKRRSKTKNRQANTSNLLT